MSDDPYEESLRRLNKAGGDVCRALGVYGEHQTVVNELVRAVRHHDAEKIRKRARELYDMAPSPKRDYLGGYHARMDTAAFIDTNNNNEEYP